MSFTLPIDALCNRQVSFRVGLPDGICTFDMAALEMAGLSSEPGMKLHLRALADSSGVTLTLFTSEQEMADSVPDPALQCGPSYIVPNTTVRSEDSVGFMPVAYAMKSTSESLAVEYLDPEDSFRTLNNIFSEPTDDGTSFDDYFSNILNVGYNNSRIHPSSHRPGGDANRDDVMQDFTTAAHSPFTDSDASTPSTFSESPSPNPQPRGSPSKLRCPSPSCTHHFTSKYTLSKHTAAQDSQKKLFPCTLGCTMRFSRKHDRLRHEVTQHGRICEWECSVCLGFFSSEATMRKHKCKSAGGTRARWRSDHW
ncbi:Transcriptional regulator prz1 [Mycena venus]|uniref:Transcriptional regulator prz1 n=1 Tax=Mycena venus TaxID=2733690 RepID=A0A8H7CLR5_9AGAR|nr:Transcriptional regulator prz1 [Mycena venus]